MPGTFQDVVELLLPELRRRGIFWDKYSVPGGTYRENLQGTPGESHPRADHPAAKLQWRAPSSVGHKAAIELIDTPTPVLLDPQAFQLQ
jgi:hypothetical protein